MYVKVNCPASGSCYQSVVYAMINSGWLLQYVVLNPYTNCFELIDYLDKTCKPAEPLVYMIQPDDSGFKRYSGSELLKFKYYCKSSGYEPIQLSYLCGYPDVCENYDFLFEILKDKRASANQYKIQIRRLEDADEWCYIKTQQDADHFMSLFAGFHDATLESLSYMEDNRGTKEVKAVFDNSGWFGIVELCFEGVELLKIVPAKENCTREIYEATLRISDESVLWCDGSLADSIDSFDGSMIRALSLKWRKQDFRR